MKDIVVRDKLVKLSRKLMSAGIKKTLSESLQGSLSSADNTTMEMENPPSSNSSNSTSEVIATYLEEEKERSKRRLNVIVHDTEESSADNGQVRKEHDVNTTMSIFDKYMGDKALLLRNCTKLRKKDNPEDIRKVYVTPDLTPQEQKHSKALRSQLAEMNKEEKKYWIKNRKIVLRGN